MSKKYRTCVSVGEPGPDAMLRALMQALKISEYAEARLDYIKEPDQIEALLESVQKNVLSKRVVCTLRSRCDGGRFQGDERRRRDLLRKVASYNPFLLDVEADALVKSRLLAEDLRRSDARLLVSWHDFSGVPKNYVLHKRLNTMSTYSPLLKVACTAQNTDEAIRMLELYGWLAEGGNRDIQSLISFAMGDAGRFTRVLCLHLGSPYTYVSIGEALAPGQLALGEVRRIEKLVDSVPQRQGRI